MSETEISVLFFRPSFLSDDVVLGDALERVSELDAQARTVEVNSGRFHIRCAKHGRSRWEGSIVRLREDPPGKARRGQDGVVDLDLGELDHPAEEAAWLYDVDSDIFVLQRNHHGATPTAVAEVVAKLGRLPVELDPLIRPDILKEYAKMRQSVTRIQFRVANLSPEAIKALGDEVRDPQALALLKAGASVGLTVAVAMKLNQPRRAFWLALVDGLAKVERKTHDSGVKRLQVFGTLGDHTTMVDLLRQRIVHKVKVARRDRRLKYAEALKGVNQAWEEQRDYLVENFKK